MKKSLFLPLLITVATCGYAQSVTIGKQTWTDKNLDATSFRNGDPIPEAKTKAEWQEAQNKKQPAWCYYDNNPANGVIYGKLYNWYAVNDPRGLAPKGWHIPSEEEWRQLKEFLGSPFFTGQKMKAKTGWKDNGGKSGNGTNESGFNALPGGKRYSNGTFFFGGFGGYWWTATEDGATLANYIGLGFDSDKIMTGTFSKGEGLSVRCVKD